MESTKKPTKEPTENIKTSQHATSCIHAKVSIIIPIFNTSKYLPDCLDSVLAQTHNNLEIILIDDGSTDESAQIADHYAQKDPRIKAIHQKNHGQSSARNIGVQKATGKFISFVDSDDSIKPNFISQLLTPYNSANISLTVCGIHYKRLKSKSAEDVYIRPTRPRRPNESSKTYILRLLTLDGRMYSSVNKLFLSKVAKTIAFDEKLNFAEDTKFVLDYLNKAKGEISFILKPLYVYNFGTSTSTIKTTGTEWANWQTSYDNLKTWLGPHPTITEKFWLHLVHLRWRISYIRSVRRAKS